MTGRPFEDREPRDDTAILPSPGAPPIPTSATGGVPAVQAQPAPRPDDGPPVAEVVALPPQQGPPPQPAYPRRPVHQPQHPGYAPQTVTHAYGAPVPVHALPTVSGGHVAIAWVIAVLSLGYMLPWAIAATRGRPNTLAIALVNLLVGWTFIGWVAALVMACLSNQVQVASPTFIQVNAPAPAPTASPPGWYPDGRGGSQYWDGRGWSSGAR